MVGKRVQAVNRVTYYTSGATINFSKFNNRMPPIYPHCSKIKTSNTAYVSVKSCNISVIYVQRVTFASYWPVILL